MKISAINCWKGQIRERSLTASWIKTFFLINIGEDKNAYRYHNLFNEFLKLQFENLSPDEKTGLQLKASKLFLDLGDYEESIGHLLKIGAYNEALKVIRSMDKSFQAWSWLGRIPLEYMKDDRDMAVQRMFYHYYNYEIKELKVLFEVFKEKMNTDGYWKVLKIAKAILVDMDLKTDIMTLDEIENMSFDGMTKAIIFLKTAAFFLYAVQVQRVPGLY